MTATYVPGTNETDQKKINQSIQQIWQNQQTDETNIATNTTNIATIQGAYVTTIAGNSGAFTLNSASGLTNSTNDIKISPASSSQFGSIKTAVKSDQTTATSTSVAVNPAVQQNHPSAAKAWVKFTGSGTNGTQTINASYNVSSVTRTTTGIYVVTFTTAFTSADYAVSAIQNANAAVNGFVQLTSTATILAGSCSLSFINISGPAGFDPTAGAMAIFFGTQ